MFYVYILKSLTDSNLYIGSTNDLERRIKEHKDALVKSTKNRLPIQLECYFAFRERKTAAKFEKYLKTGSGKAFIKNHFEIKK